MVSGGSRRFALGWQRWQLAVLGDASAHSLREQAQYSREAKAIKKL